MKRRCLRVADSIHRILALALQKEIPSPEAWMINITQVTLSQDLRLARVYFTSLSQDFDRSQCERLLAENRAILKRSLARNLHLRFLPEVKFCWDEETLRVQKVEEILDSLKNQNARNCGKE